MENQNEQFFELDDLFPQIAPKTQLNPSHEHDLYIDDADVEYSSDEEEIDAAARDKRRSDFLKKAGYKSNFGKKGRPFKISLENVMDIQVGNEIHEIESKQLLKLLEDQEKAIKRKKERDLLKEESKLLKDKYNDLLKQKNQIVGKLDPLDKQFKVLLDAYTKERKRSKKPTSRVRDYVPRERQSKKMPSRYNKNVTNYETYNDVTYERQKSEDHIRLLEKQIQELIDILLKLIV